jgi:crotonobetainyl-CoA:carnitine CoA-transferase CaiB-like acyl-CoA transferase
VPYQAFDAADRQIVVAVGSDAQWVACARALDLADLAADPALLTNAGRLAARDRVAQLIGDRLRERPAKLWMERLAAAGVPAGLVLTVKEALAEVEASPFTGIAPSVPGSVRLPPPRLGEHDADIRARGWRAFDH